MISTDRGRNLKRTALAFGALAVVTAVMLLFRGRLDKAHVALLYLLVVLGGSASGGRLIGIALGGAAFLLFNLLFLQPYYSVALADPLDWLVLLTFLVTSIVAAELLDRERRQAALAAALTRELDQLATLGAETLNAARAEDALEAIAGVIQRLVGVERCELFVWEADHRTLRSIASPVTPSSPAAGPRDATQLLAYVVDARRTAIEREDGTVHVVDESRQPGGLVPTERARAIAFPLIARGHAVGALRVSGVVAFALSPEQSRVLTALAYYAALGIERLSLERSQETTEALRRADRLKDALLAAVSHDLRTPLTTIKGIAHEIAEEGNSRAGIIEDEADRLASLVEGLLELSQLDAGAMRVEREVNTVDDLIGVALQRAERVLSGHPVRVRMDDQPLLIGRFDLGHSLRVLVNLLENAAKYAPIGTAIDLAAQRVGEAIEVTVADRGPGIPGAERERIFEAFYRIPGAPPDVRGAGLGLSIARRLARAQGGDLLVAPRDGGGSTFTLRLPAS